MFYNPKRRHTHNGRVAPVIFEQQYFGEPEKCLEKSGLIIFCGLFKVVTANGRVASGRGLVLLDGFGDATVDLSEIGFDPREIDGVFAAFR